MTRSSAPKRQKSKPFVPATDAEKEKAFQMAGQLEAHLEDRKRRLAMLDELLAAQEKPQT